jgi:pentalenic acid synthase
MSDGRMARPLETDRPTPFDPPIALRKRAPLSRLAYPDGHVGWVATGNAVTRAILTDQRFSTRRELLHQPIGRERAHERPTPAEPGIFPHMDPPEHTRYRRLLSQHFSPRRVAELTPAIRRYTAHALDDMADGGPPVDLVASFAMPIPALVICELLGVPAQDRHLIQAATAVMNDLDSTPEHAVEAVMSITGTVRGLIMRLRAPSTPSDDGLLAHAVATGDLSDDELTNLGMVLLATGHLPTSSMLALGTFVLLTDPDQRARLAADPELPEQAVEELLRYLSILQFDVRRTALVDVEIDGQVIAAGETVVLALPVANRDPARFADPDKLDLARSPAGHLAFGHGIHQCLGQHLARAELRIALTGLFERFPGLRLAVPAAEVPTRDRMAVYGVDRLPVTWGAVPADAEGIAMSTSEHDMLVPPTFPMERTSPFAPPAEYQQMRASAPLVRANLPNGAPVWAVTRHAEARQILSDPRISSNTGRPERPRGPDDDRPDDGFFIEMDPPEHSRYRRLLISELGARPVAAMRPRIQRIVDTAIDEMLETGSPADLVESFARPVPSRVICELLGVPASDHEFFESRLRMLTVMNLDPRAPQASRDLRGYLRELIRSAERAPQDGLIGRLAARHLPTGELTTDALINIGFLLLLAGYESPANTISLGVLTLLEHPAQLAALRADASLLPGATEELLRFHSVVDWVSFDRTAADDLNIGGVQICAGDRLTVLAASANRDERAFENPDEFDIRRSAHHHLAFGYGIHQCIGHNLARAELEIAYGTLLTRIPTLHLAAGLEQLPFAYDAAFFGPHAMPVAW